MELFSSGEFPSVVVTRGVRHARFRLMSDVDASTIVGRGEAKAMATKQKASRAITKELAYFLSRRCTVDATTMLVRVVNGQVVPPFAEGATMP